MKKIIASFTFIVAIFAGFIAGVTFVINCGGGGNGTTPVVASETSFWTKISNDIYYSLGKVGIGKDNPSTTLDVLGTVTATSFIGDGNGITNLNIGDTIGENAGQIWFNININDSGFTFPTRGRVKIKKNNTRVNDLYIELKDVFLSDTDGLIDEGFGMYTYNYKMDLMIWLSPEEVLNGSVSYQNKTEQDSLYGTYWKFYDPHGISKSYFIYYKKDSSWTGTLNITIDTLNNNYCSLSFDADFTTILGSSPIKVKLTNGNIEDYIDIGNEARE